MADEVGPQQTPGGRAVRQAGELRSARIESLRALAALAVLCSHVYLFAGPAAYRSYRGRVLLGGGFGVWVFFGLTGYLLYLPFARRDLAGGPAPSFGRYAFNRAVRILPLYYVVTLVYLVVLRHPGGPGYWVRFLLFGENFSRATIGRLDGPVWSLVVELHFYVLLPLLAAGIGAVSRGSRTRAVAVLAALGAVALAVRWDTVLRTGGRDLLWRYNLPATFFFFVPGMLLAVLKVSCEEARPDWLRGPARRPAAWLLATVPIWLVVTYRYDWDPLVGAATFLLIGACVLPLEPSPLVRALEWRPLAVVGVASYSLYLWHLPIVTELGGHQLRGEPMAMLWIVLVPLSCVIALASYRIVEAPFLTLRKRWQGSPVRAVSGRREPEPTPGG